jgi:short-subunit dehydrogenase
MTSANGTALITGASSGIGAIYADRLARRGYDLILVARGEETLTSVANAIAAATGRAAIPVRADLGSPKDLRRVEVILQTDPSITMLVNNAGIGSVKPLLKADVDDMQRMIEINVVALTRLVYAAAPAFAARKRGTIINLASALALAPEKFNGVYGASKAFVLALTQSLQAELSGDGLRFQAVLPGAIATPFWESSGGSLDHLPDRAVMRPEDAVDAALAGLDLGELVTLPSLPDSEDWNTFDATRQGLIPKISSNVAASRYRTNGRA